MHVAAHADSFAIKRMRKIGQRRAVDYTSTGVWYMQDNSRSLSYSYFHFPKEASAKIWSFVFTSGSWDFPSGSCKRKLFGARHFAASAITRGIFNATQDYVSPFDGDGHARKIDICCIHI
ncbi:hypothetical protein ACET3Z_030606 [Daucus carota]